MATHSNPSLLGLHRAFVFCYKLISFVHNYGDYTRDPCATNIGRKISLRGPHRTLLSKTLKTFHYFKDIKLMSRRQISLQCDGSIVVLKTRNLRLILYVQITYRVLQTSNRVLLPTLTIGRD